MTALAKYVAVRDDDGIVHSFGPPDGDNIPAWAKKQITNPKVWEGGEDDGDGVGDGGGDNPPSPPPKSGKGSGEDQWRAYAEAVGVDVSEADSRDDVITLLELAEVPTE